MTFLRPDLGYIREADLIAQSIELTTRLERIQRPATKYILILPFSTTVNNVPRLQSPFLSPVCYWRDYLNLVLLFKIAHGLVKGKATLTQSHLYTRTPGLLDFHLALLFVMPYLNARLPPIKDPTCLSNNNLESTRAKLCMSFCWLR